MKKQMLAIIIITAFLFGCAGNDGNQNAKDAPLSEEETELIHETETIDSVTMEMDKAKEEIEKSSDKLDELLNDL